MTKTKFLSKNVEIENLLNKIENCFIKPAEKILYKQKTKKKQKTKPKTKPTKTKAWFDKVCRDLRRELRYSSKALNSNPKNPVFKNNFFQLK